MDKKQEREIKEGNKDPLKNLIKKGIHGKF